MKNTDSEDFVEPKIFCFDFDQTLVIAHYHHLLNDAKRAARNEGTDFDPVKETRNLLDNHRYGLKNAEKIKNIIQSALRNNHYVAIASFTSFPECFEPTLKHLELTKEEISKIPRFFGLPRGKDAGKAEHLQKIMDLTGITDRSNVYLIDDDVINCDLARKDGFKAVIVPLDICRNPSYLNEILIEANKPAMPNEMAQTINSINERGAKAAPATEPINAKKEPSALESLLLRRQRELTAKETGERKK